MFAAFGTITFQVLGSPTRFEREKKYVYEKLEVIGAPPILQWIYDDLRKLRFDLVLHQLWSNPDQAFAQLEALAESHDAQALVFGNGALFGNFVITQLAAKEVLQADDGTTVVMEVSIELEEFVASALPAGAPPMPITIGDPPGLTTSQDNAPGATVVQAPATASPSGIPMTGDFTGVPDTTIARWGAD